MNKDDFIKKNAAVLGRYAFLSQTAGTKPDIVQGGGGNTSAKLDDNYMAIKASGYRLSQVSPQNCYAVLNHSNITRFYTDNSPEMFEDVEKAGSEACREATVSIDGFSGLKPSVESGFHSILRRYVLHTHPVYANLACCCLDGENVVKEAMNGMPYAFIPYINPGTSLTFAILHALDAVKKEQGESPSIIFLQNHGLISTNDDANACLYLHDEANRRIARAFGVTVGDYPLIKISDIGGGLLRSGTEYLQNSLCGLDKDISFFTEESFYPDQMVYLTGAIEIKNGNYDGKTPEAACTVYTGSGEVIYNAPQSKAMTIEETLTAIMYLHDKINASGRRTVSMGESARSFIAGWDSEKYRKGLL